MRSFHVDKKFGVPIKMASKCLSDKSKEVQRLMRMDYTHENIYIYIYSKK